MTENVEIERLQALHAEVANECERLQAVIVAGDREIKAAHADCDRYREEIERLQAALREIADDPTGISTYQAEIAKIALEGK